MPIAKRSLERTTEGLVRQRAWCEAGVQGLTLLICMALILDCSIKGVSAGTFTFAFSLSPRPHDTMAGKNEETKDR